MRVLGLLVNQCVGPLSVVGKRCDKLEELEKLGVIEKVSGPTSWVNPLVAVEKPN
jgi:hypothetical protein